VRVITFLGRAEKPGPIHQVQTPSKGFLLRNTFYHNKLQRSAVTGGDEDPEPTQGGRTVCWGKRGQEKPPRGTWPQSENPEKGEQELDQKTFTQREGSCPINQEIEAKRTVRRKRQKDLHQGVVEEARSGGKVEKRPGWTGDECPPTGKAKQRRQASGEGRDRRGLGKKFQRRTPEYPNYQWTTNLGFQRGRNSWGAR